MGVWATLCGESGAANLIGQAEAYRLRHEI